MSLVFFKRNADESHILFLNFRTISGAYNSQTLDLVKDSLTLSLLKFVILLLLFKKINKKNEPTAVMFIRDGG